MAGIIIDIEPTIWAYTSTKTISGTITGNPGSLLYIEYPAATETESLEYTRMPTISGKKTYPTPLPVLVLTEYDAVIVDSTGSIIETQTMIQSPPPMSPTLPAGYNPGTKVYLIPPIWGWGAWSKTERTEVCVSLVFLLVLCMLTSAMLWAFVKKRKAYEITYGETFNDLRAEEAEFQRRQSLQAPGT